MVDGDRNNLLHVELEPSECTKGRDPFRLLLLNGIRASSSGDGCQVVSVSIRHMRV